MGKRRRTIKNDVTFRDLSEQKALGDERQLDAAIRIDYIALHAQNDVAVVGSLRDVA